MLDTVVHNFRARNDATRIAIGAGPTRPFRALAQYGVEYLWPSASLYGRAGKYKLTFQINNLASRFVKPARLTPYGLASRFEVDGLVDISGYSFGDHWGVRPILNMEILTRFYHRRKKPVVLLPQMLGPFQDQTIRESFRRMAANCDLIYARDQVSLEAGKQAAPSAQISLAPDITISTKSGESSPVDTNLIGIVPNIRVVDSGEAPWNESDYLQLLADAAIQCRKANKKVVLVVHDKTGQDATLAEKLKQQTGDSTIEILAEPDPLILKNFISGCRFLIGSRFHSLVAALSSNVPAIGIGWAHKYQQLLNDFGQQNFNVARDDTKESISEKIQLLNSEAGLAECKQILLKENSRLNEQNRMMWDQVFSILER